MVLEGWWLEGEEEEEVEEVVEIRVKRGWKGVGGGRAEGSCGRKRWGAGGGCEADIFLVVGWLVVRLGVDLRDGFCYIIVVFEGCSC